MTLFEKCLHCDDDNWTPIDADQMRAELQSTYPNTEEIIDMIYCHKLPAQTRQATYRRYIPNTIKDWAKS